MVEGDGCHRVAAEHRKSLVNRRFTASSPNGKFKAGALAIMKAGGVLKKIEVHGKNMFYFFGTKDGPATLVVHIHFGMAGAFAVYKGEEPAVTANTRLRLATETGKPSLVAHLSAMTVDAGLPEELYHPKVAKLGPDPLREDAEPQKFVERCGLVKKPIGLMLMDQSCMAGVGNIYRSETLYEAGIHPEQPANTLSQQELLHLWNIITKQMQAGFKTGSIWGTKDGAAVYGLERSSCGGKVRQWIMGGRQVYACEKAQTLDKDRKIVAAPALVKAGIEHLGKATAAVVAEEKKRRTGEGLAVQHVALKDDATRAAALKAAKTKKSSPATRKVQSKSGARTKAETNSKTPAVSGKAVKAKAQAKARAKAQAKAKAKAKAQAQAKTQLKLKAARQPARTPAKRPAGAAAQRSGGAKRQRTATMGM